MPYLQIQLTSGMDKYFLKELCSSSEFFEEQNFDSLSFRD